MAPHTIAGAALALGFVTATAFLSSPATAWANSASVAASRPHSASAPAPAGYLGVAIATPIARHNRAMGIPTGEPLGVAIRGVIPGSPAERAGLRAGDVVVELTGAATGRLTRQSQFLRATLDARPGDSLTLRVWRAAEKAGEPARTLTVDVPVADNPNPVAARRRLAELEREEGVRGSEATAAFEEDAAQELAAHAAEPTGGDPLAVAGLTLGTAAPAEVAGGAAGLRVMQVWPNSEASRAGLFPGDRILRIEGGEVAHRTDVQTILARRMAAAAAQGAAQAHGATTPEGIAIRIEFERDGRPRRTTLFVPASQPASGLSGSSAPAAR